MWIDFERAIKEVSSWELYGSLHCIEGNYFSSALAVICAYVKSKGIPFAGLNLPSDVDSYASALGIPAALGSHDLYPFNRTNEGTNYSRMVHLDSVESTEEANSCINSCVRNLLSNCNETCVSELNGVIGDLHDNVWSHGMNSGFSVAQKYPRMDQFQFTLVDCGIGLLESLRLSTDPAIAVLASNDCEALEWCIQRGNSSKLPPVDEWAQRVPDELGMGFDGIPTYVHDGGSHHQGIGLAKCIEYVDKYNGSLTIITGNAKFELRADGHRSTEQYTRSIQESWSGVAINCKLNLADLVSCQSSQEETQIDSILSDWGLSG